MLIAINQLNTIIKIRNIFAPFKYLTNLAFCINEDYDICMKTT